MKKVNALKYLSRFLCLLVVASMTACGDDDDDDNNDDDEPAVDELVNTYQFTSATFGEATVIAINNPADQTMLVPASFAVGDDGTLFLVGAIEGAAECAEGVDVGIELREDGTSFYVCNGDGVEDQQGTWVVNPDRSVFTLSITSLGVDVILDPWTLTSTTLSGTATIPLPFDATVDLTTGEQTIATGTENLTEASVALLAAGGLSVPVGTPNIQTVSMEITFTVASF